MAPQQSQQPDGPQGSGPDAGGEGADGCAQEPAGEGGIRAAERSAERAAALAATEGFHPLRLRPYVGEPHDEPGTTVRPLLDAAGDGPDTADLGLFPETYAEFAADGEEYAAYGDAALAAEAAAAHGRHRRRRRGIVVAAAAVAASALAAGAVAVTGQVMGDEQGATGHALPDLSASVPDVTLPADASPATAGTARPVTHRPAAPAATTATVPPSPTPSRTTPAPPPVSPTGSIATTPAPTTPPTDTPPIPTQHAVQAPQVLRLGDTGPAVADLQRRLTEVWVYDGPIDGIFDREVQAAVATFQVWYWVSDEPDGSHDGVYGPHTRAVLERQTH